MIETIRVGFEDTVRVLLRTVGRRRRERVVEDVFRAVAHEEGNGLGYDTIAASGNHTNTLHWIDNDRPVNEDDLILVDAGIEIDPLYAADITRTLPVSDCFTETQARVYQAVLGTCEVALARVNEPGTHFRDVHNAATFVIATRLREWGLLPVSVEGSLSPAGQQHRRRMPHGTSHYLGFGVHNCAQARREMHRDALSEPGTTLTIESGLYLRADDEVIPAEYRGIGMRIGSDVVVNENGSVTRISEDIPRTTNDIETRIARTQGC